MVTDLYDDVEVENEDHTISYEQQLIKKDVKIRTSIYLEDIKRYDETVNEKGNIKKGYTKLFLSSGDNIIVKESYKTIDELLSTNKIGFRYGK